MLTWSITGAEGMVRRLGTRGPILMEALRTKMDALDIMLQSKIQGKLNNVLLRSHTMHLIGSIRAVPARIEGGTVSGTVQGGGGLAPYGKFLERGTAPHDIVGKNSPKAVLAFMVGNKQIFAKRVHHPGNRPYRFMRDTQREMIPTIISELQKAANEAMNQ